MPRHKFTTTDQRLAASRASIERERQRKKLVGLCSQLADKKPDSVVFLAAFWETRRLYLDIERQLEYLLWAEGIFKRPLLLDSSLTSKGGPDVQQTPPPTTPITRDQTGGSSTLPDSGV